MCIWCVIYITHFITAIGVDAIFQQPRHLGRAAFFRCLTQRLLALGRGTRPAGSVCVYVCEREHMGASVDAVTGLPEGCVGTPAMALRTVDEGVR